MDFSKASFISKLETLCIGLIPYYAEARDLADVESESRQVLIQWSGV